MRIFTWNVNSLAPTVRNINLKYGSLAAFFASLDADVVAMQEVKLPEPKLTAEYVLVEGYQSYWACSTAKPGYSGVTTWVRESLAARSAEADPFEAEGCEHEGRALVTDHGSFVLINVYVPNAGARPERPRLAAKLAFMAALQARVDAELAAGREVVVVGDLNIAAERRDVHTAINWEGLFDSAETAALRGLLGPGAAAAPADGGGAPAAAGCLTDAWRHFHPETSDVFTVWDEKRSSRAFNVGQRIDFVLLSKRLLDAAVSCEVLLDLPPKWSDHAPCLAELQLPPPSSQPPAGQQQQQQPAQLAPKPPKPPACAMWQALLKRFQDPSQRSIAAMFKAASSKPKPAQQQQPQPQPGGQHAGAAAAAPAAAASAASGGAPAAAVQKRPGEQAGSSRSAKAARGAGDTSPGHAAAAPPAAAAAGEDAPGKGASQLQQGQQLEVQRQLELREQPGPQLEPQPEPPRQQAQQPTAGHPQQPPPSSGTASSAGGSSSSSRGKQTPAATGRAAPRGKKKAAAGKQQADTAGGARQAKLSAFFGAPKPGASQED